MDKLSWKEWLGVGTLALVVALGVVLGVGQAVQGYREHQALLNVVGYNIQQGKLLPLPQGAPAQAAPAPARPAAPPAAEAPAKPQDPPKKSS